MYIGTGKRAQLYYSLSHFFFHFIYLLNKRHGRNIVLAEDNESTHTYVNTVRVCTCLSEVPKSDRRKLSALSVDNNNNMS